MAKITDIQSIIMEMASQQKSENQYITAGNTALNQSKHEVHEVVQIPESRYAYGNNKPTIKKEENKAVAGSSSKSNYALIVEDAIKTLIAGKDFCQIKGVKEPVLVRSGLVKILRCLGYRFSTKLVDKQLIDGILAYTVEVVVINSDGEFVCSALGSSNSGEKKFMDKALSSDNVLTAIASTRALRCCVKDILVR